MASRRRCIADAGRVTRLSRISIRTPHAAVRPKSVHCGMRLSGEYWFGRDVGAGACCAVVRVTSEIKRRPAARPAGRLMVLGMVVASRNEILWPKTVSRR